MKYLFALFGLSILLVAEGCRKARKDCVEKNILLSGYERVEKDSVKKIMELTILNVYPSSRECRNVEKYANLYKAQIQDSTIIYVFELCSKVPDFVYDTTGRYVPLIIPEEILNEKQTTVTVFVPQDFNIPKGAKYLFCKLGVLGDS